MCSYLLCREKAEGEGEAEVTAEQEEEDASAKEMTLDEYKAQHNVVSVDLTVFQLETCVCVCNV